MYRQSKVANYVLKTLGKLRDDQTGATAVEYGLIIALVVLAAMGAIVGLASATIEMWDNVATEVDQA
ncbi:MAG: Flp family type IVb pilin [Sphingomonadaceae bacterium]